GHDIAQQGDQGIDLGVAVGLPLVANRAGIDDLYADGCHVQVAAGVPLTYACMPGAAAVIDELVDARWIFISDQVVAADVACREDVDRARSVSRRVMDHDGRDPAAVTYRLDTAVDVQGAGSGCATGHKDGGAHN